MRAWPSMLHGCSPARVPGSRPWSANARGACGTALVRQAAGAADRAHRRAAYRQSGGARKQVLALTGQAGELVARSVREARASPPRRAGGAWPRRPAKACCCALSGAGRRPGRADRRADREASRRRADHRPDGLARRPRRAPDRQGQARQAVRVRLRLPAGRTDREHAPRRARADPASSQPNRLTERERAAAHHGCRARAAAGQTARGRARWRLSRRGRQRGAARQRRLHRRTAAARRAGHENAWPATASAAKAGSATSNAATGCAEAD